MYVANGYRTTFGNEQNPYHTVSLDMSNMKQFKREIEEPDKKRKTNITYT